MPCEKQSTADCSSIDDGSTGCVSLVSLLDVPNTIVAHRFMTSIDTMHFRGFDHSPGDSDCQLPSGYSALEPVVVTFPCRNVAGRNIAVGRNVPFAMRLVKIAVLLLVACLVTARNPNVSASDELGSQPNPVEAVAPKPEDLEFFESKIRPLLLTHCAECHALPGGDNTSAKGGLTFLTRESLLKGGDSGPALVPGKPGESLLIEAVSYQTESLQMPPRGRLSATQVELLTQWIERGAPFPKVTAAAAPAHRTIDFAAGRTFWSFQPVNEQSPPAIENDSWAQTKIDRFVLARMSAARLTPAPEADRLVLLRRVSFDLRGLPPTESEVAEYLADSSEEAYAHLVERMLASPHYGERWGRYWLDLVRYADTLESWAQDKQARAWHYRDWVVNAFNRDLPYDQFLHLQLAADQVPESSPTDLAALGLLGLSPSYWKELKLDPSVIKTVVAEEWEERIQMLSGAVLGLTVACARCHDHKQDPIGTDDYYALAGVLANTRVIPRPLLPSSEAELVKNVRQQIDELTRQRDPLKANANKTPEQQQQESALTQQIADIERAHPQLNAPVAFAVEDSALYVLPDGPDRTKIEYRPQETINVAMQIRGNPANSGAVVERRFLRVLSAQTPPAPFQRGSGRLELAQSLTNDSASLTARVIVNRVWRHHFGRGLVETPSNFGSTGLLPTHPELLDDLAARFIANGWSFKWLHREILLSATYRMSSRATPQAKETDPDNHWLSHMNRRRLDVEAWRDAMLTTTGLLREELGGGDFSLDEIQIGRRTIYGNVRRRELNALLLLHDFPDPVQHASHRDATTTPLQQLFVLNSPLMAHMATSLAKRVLVESPSDRTHQIDRIYQLVFQRPPSDSESGAIQRFLDNPSRSDTVEVRWTQLAHALLGSNEFAFVD